MQLSIILVSWNTRQLLADCLNSVYTHPPKDDFELLVVDNASHDGSAAMVRERFPQARLIQSNENVGFAQGNNLAVPLCIGKYVLLLNPDTVVKPDALDSLVRFMEAHPMAGAAGSRLLNPDETLQPSCHPAPTLSRELWRLFHLDAIRPYGAYHMHQWDMNQPREVDVIQGASFILRKTALDQVGFLDGRYFMYSEEVDLCYRLQKAGWKLYYVPESQVIHYGGQSTKLVAADMFQQLYMGKLMYFRKHYGRLAGIGYKLILLAAALSRLLLTPFAWLQKPAQREKNLTLARHYGRLLIALPTL
jgi:hypothetical protein